MKPTAVAPPALPPLEIFRAFLLLGLTSFGGPVAHLGYFHDAFVRRRQWLDEAQFAQLLAVCQFLPGPASSQLGFGIGLLRGGWPGALAAFAGFTLPSALLMLAFAMLAPRLEHGTGAAVVHGLKLVAVAVVAHGVLGMWRTLAPDLPRSLMVVAAAALVAFAGEAWLQLAVIVLGALAGLWLCRGVAVPAPVALPVRYGAGTAVACMAVFAGGVALALALGSGPPSAADAGPDASHLAAAFYRAGALVFGGGHVVLPLLQQGVVEPGWVGSDGFLAGYGAAQAVPGPMFTLAAFLGAQAWPQASVAGAAIALAAVFLPGFLLLVAVLPAWARLAGHPGAARAVAGINATVVGLLLAALYDPVLSQGVRGVADLLVAGTGFALLAVFRLPPLWTVAWCVGASVLRAGLVAGAAG